MEEMREKQLQILPLRVRMTAALKEPEGWMKSFINKISKLASASRSSRVGELAAVHSSRYASERVKMIRMNGAGEGLDYSDSALNVQLRTERLIAH